MLIDFPILTYIVLVPAVGAVFTYISGSDPVARPVPVLRLLGGRPDPDVLPHRGLGRAAQEVRRDQVLHVHLPREPPAARSHLRVLLLLESAHVRHASDHRDDADPGGNDRGPDVRRPLDCVRHETADLAAAYVAA